MAGPFRNVEILVDGAMYRSSAKAGNVCEVIGLDERDNEIVFLHAYRNSQGYRWSHVQFLKPEHEDKAWRYTDEPVNTEPWREGDEPDDRTW